jgi:hypothetical protein
MTPRCHQAAKLAATATLPPPHCHHDIATALLPHCLPPPPCCGAAAAAALPPLLPRQRRRCRADAAALPPHPTRCPRIRRRAATTTAALMPPSLPRFRLSCRCAAAAAALSSLPHHCHELDRLHRNEGEEDKCGSKQRVIAAHHQGNAPPPAPWRYPDIVVGIAQIRKEEHARGRAEAADALLRRSAPPSPRARS